MTGSETTRTRVRFLSSRNAADVLVSWHLLTFLLFADDSSGVWVNDEKVAAVGISSSRWITTHGFALNLDPNLEYFDASMIVPCGIEGKGVTSIAKIMRERGDTRIPGLKEVAAVVMEAMVNVFRLSDLRVAESPKFDNKNQ